MQRILITQLLLFSYSLAIGQINISRGPYLQELTDTSVVVCWRTDVVTDAKVHYDQNLGGQSFSVSDFSQLYDHQLKISNLNPNTTYYYQIENGGQLLAGGTEGFRFRTAPPPYSEQPIRIWTIGDFGKGNTMQKKVRDAYLNWTDTNHTDVWLWLGDNAYQSGTDNEYQTKVFDSVNAYGQIMPYMPFMPCPGNHDYMSVSPPSPISSINPWSHSGPYYDIVDVPTNGEGGGYPSGTELYYSFDYGNVHFLSINSELGSINLLNSSHDWIGTLPYFNTSASSFVSSPMTDWIHNDLQQNDKTWTIVYFHQPPFTDGSHDSEAFWEVFMKAMRENILPILEQYNVDLVMAGHSHVYERSYLIKGHYDDPNTFNASTMIVNGNSGYDSLGQAYLKDLNQANGDEGTMYIVCGNSASVKSNPGLNYPAMYYGYGCDTCAGSLVLDIEGGRLDGRFITAHNEELDHFTILKDSIQNSSSHLLMNKETYWGVYPNPFNDVCNVALKLENARNVKLSLLDIKGKFISNLYSSVKLNSRVNINLSPALKKLDPGNYLLRLTTDRSKHIKKIVKI